MTSVYKAIFIAGVAALTGFAALIPPGTHVRVRMGQTISSDKARSGDNWEGTLASDVKVHGQVIARRGDPVHGKVVTAESSGRLSKPGLLQLQLRSIVVNGRAEPVVSGTYSVKGKSHKSRDAKAAGGTAALGAVIGAVAGGGKGAAIGAGAGAAAGTAGAAVTGKRDVRIPVERVLTFTIR